jgi:predicted acetyltransferase
MGAYSEKITEGHIGVTVTTEADRTDAAEEALRQAGIDGEIIRGWQ